MAYHQESLLGQVERVEAPNPTTLRLVLKQPFGPLLNVLGTSMMKIISPKSIQDDMEGAVVNPVGTGPFKFVRWDRRASLEMVRNDDFWGEKAYLDRIIWKYVPESSVRLSEVETGASQLFDTVGVRDADRVRNNRQLQMLTNVFPSWLYAWFNLRMPPLENVKVRQAMCYAINYEGIVNNLYNGIGALPDAGPLGPGLVGYQKGLNPYKYDPARARTLLQESGVTTPFNISMLSSNYTRAYCPVGMDRVAQAIQADFGQVGIQVNLQILDASPYRAAIADPATRPHFFIGGWVNDYPDQDQFIFANGESTQSFNRGFWSNPQFDQAVREAQVITDEARRAQLYQQAAKIYFDEAPQVVFNYGLLNSVARSTVHNLKLTSHTAWKFDQVWMD
jgi:peptide/nickel transport system substrate-binding protein